MRESLLYNEKELLEGIAAGNEWAFRSLFELYKERFYAVALKMTRSDAVAEDIVQDVFMSIWDKRETLRNIENPSSYFFTAVYRRVYRYYQKTAMERKVLETALYSPVSANVTEEVVLANESSALISQAVSKLPPQQQLVFKLSKHDGFSRDEVARQLSISPNTVRNHLADAVKFVRTFLRNSTITSLVIFWFLEK